MSSNALESKVKRRKLMGKQPEETETSMITDKFHKVLRAADQALPHVGARELNHTIQTMLQSMFPEKEICFVYGCRGTDRTMIPTKEIHEEETPFCRSVMLLRSKKTSPIRNVVCAGGTQTSPCEPPVSHQHHHVWC